MKYEINDNYKSGLHLFPIVEATVKFDYYGKTLEAKIGPQGIFIDSVGQWDGITTKIFGKTTHICGASGFGWGINDKCPGCDYWANERLIESFKKLFQQRK